LIEKIVFLPISSFNLNSFLQTHLGAVGCHVSVFLTGTNYLGRAGVIDSLAEKLLPAYVCFRDGTGAWS
jgi:hypothetical protein